MKVRNKVVISILATLCINAVYADDAGEFTPVAGSGSPFSQVHFFPKRGNKIIINGKSETIPAGTGVMSGGVIGTYNDASIDKEEHQKLKGSMLYYVYVYMKNKKMMMDFSQTGHKEDPKYGNEVHAVDPTRSLVGMVYTTEEGKFLGNNRSQLTSSWFNRGHTALIQQLEGASTDSATAKEVSTSYRLEWLQWGINNKFQQGFTVPNIYFNGTVSNSKPGSYVQVSIGINGTTPVTFNGTYYQIDSKSVGYVGTVATGANGTNEGYTYATFLLSNAGGGGTATVKSGAIYSSPLES